MISKKKTYGLCKFAIQKNNVEHIFEKHDFGNGNIRTLKIQFEKTKFQKEKSLVIMISKMKTYGF